MSQVERTTLNLMLIVMGYSLLVYVEDSFYISMIDQAYKRIQFPLNE